MKPVQNTSITVPLQNRNATHWAIKQSIHNMTTPIKQRANFHSVNNTPLHGSSRKAKTAPTDHMTPSRTNRVNHPPKPPQPESVDPNSGDGEGIQGTSFQDRIFILP